MLDGFQVIVLPGSVSRNSGGLFTSVRRLTESVRESDGGFQIDVIGHCDEFTTQDLSKWKEPPFVLRSSRILALARELSLRLTESNPSIVHSHFIWSYASIASLRWKKRNPGAIHVVSPRGMLDPWALRNSRSKKWIARLLYEERNLSNASCLHALCESELYSIRRLGLKNPVCVLPNGIDLPDSLELADMREKSRLQKAEHSGSNTMLFLGRIHPKKGIISLLQAWAIAKAQLSDWKLVIAGWDDGNHLDQLRMLVKELRIDAAVEFPGPLFGQQKEQALIGADAFILPSFSEGLPMAVLEAWAYGLPVLMTESCNLPEGFAANAAIQISNEPTALADSLAQFAAIGDLGVDMGVNGRTLVEQRFQWSSIGQRMAQTYRWLLGCSDPPSWVDFVQ